MKESDKKVKELWDVVAKKKAEIQIAEKPSWKTNCTFSFNRDVSNPHQRFNIQTVVDSKEFVEALAFLYIQEDSFDRASKDLGVKQSFKWQGFSVEDWKTDFQTRIAKVKVSDKKKELAVLETRLNALLSPELKMELELADIQKTLESE